jgi:hypothetical protein
MGHLPDEYKYNVDGSTMIIEIDGTGAIVMTGRA